MESEETITISKKEYNSLLDDQNWRTALENGGVDNWEWYGESLSEYWAKKDEEEE